MSKLIVLVGVAVVSLALTGCGKGHQNPTMSGNTPGQSSMGSQPSTGQSMGSEKTSPGGGTTSTHPGTAPGTAQ
jgi:hypothetical protein